MTAAAGGGDGELQGGREPVWSQTQFYDFCFKRVEEGMSPLKTVTKH